MDEALLTIVISTYNRRDRLKNNLERMICHLDNRVRIIVGDNNSDDGTRDYLMSLGKEIETVFNSQNMGFENCWLLSFYVSTPYFVFVNDRDFFPSESISEICDLIQRIEEVDILSCEKGKWREGYIYGNAFVDVYFASRHPGTLIYRTEYCNALLDEKKIKSYIENNQPNLFNIYLVKTLLSNLSRGYAHKRYLIKQPDDREKIKQGRKDYYGCSYITLEYRKKEAQDWISTYFLSNPTSADINILVGVIKNSFDTLSIEFYHSVQLDGFAKRNRIQGAKKTDWKINLKEYMLFLIFDMQVGRLGISMKVLWLYVRSLFRCRKLILIDGIIKTTDGLFTQRKRSKKI